ncbi:MAG: hypothetical protein RJA24_189 [Pseudomonadota bacterium]|jgi:hypothetical protein
MHTMMAGGFAGLLIASRTGMVVDAIQDIGRQ